MHNNYTPTSKGENKRRRLRTAFTAAAVLVAATVGAIAGGMSNSTPATTSGRHQTKSSTTSQPNYPSITGYNLPDGYFASENVQYNSGIYGNPYSVVIDVTSTSLSNNTDASTEWLQSKPAPKGAVPHILSASQKNGVLSVVFTPVANPGYVCDFKSGQNVEDGMGSLYCAPTKEYLHAINLPPYPTAKI
jgi:hypothetical protein